MSDNVQPAKMSPGRLREPLNRTFVQRQRSFPTMRIAARPKRLPRVIAALLLAMCAFAATAQTALVTIYASGFHAKSLVPFATMDYFSGDIWDGDTHLVSFHEVKVHTYTRFITLSLPSGPHNLGATIYSHAPSDGRLTVNLESGKRYFFKVETVSAQLGFSSRARLTQVACTEAIPIATAAQPLDPKEPPATRVDEAVFPTSCADIDVQKPSTSTKP